MKDILIAPEKHRKSHCVNKSTDYRGLETTLEQKERQKNMTGDKYLSPAQVKQQWRDFAITRYSNRNHRQNVVLMKSDDPYSYCERDTP